MPDPRFKVIVSTQELYSLWPEPAEAPLGWDVGEVSSGTLEECLHYIAYAWRDRDKIPSEGYAVIINDQDMLSVTLAGHEPPEGWRYATDSLTLTECLSVMRDAWLGKGPLPEPFRPETGDSAEPYEDHESLD